MQKIKGPVPKSPLKDLGSSIEDVMLYYLVGLTGRDDSTRMDYLKQKENGNYKSSLMGNLKCNSSVHHEPQWLQANMTYSSSSSYKVYEEAEGANVKWNMKLTRRKKMQRCF
nr:hypothetical protein [Tanacetum cinerariifolium]